uniref:Voltage-dependent P/Q-type calcium channel subunit alpha-1A-like protein n=1 Tax=Streptomyces sp. FR1 TaxID=349971 RepID=I1VH35_9ACTN|nr:voltage-dependent P/Q-type calcium channel subunit alpha-1A-like protein [Streptomyces sp. FR1]
MLRALGTRADPGAEPQAGHACGPGPRDVVGRHAARHHGGCADRSRRWPADHAEEGPPCALPAHGGHVLGRELQVAHQIPLSSGCGEDAAAWAPPVRAGRRGRVGLRCSGHLHGQGEVEPAGLFRGHPPGDAAEVVRVSAVVQVGLGLLGDVVPEDGRRGVLAAVRPVPGYGSCGGRDGHGKQSNRLLN